LNVPFDVYDENKRVMFVSFGGGFRELVEDHDKAEGDKIWQ
jgi:hypothetical protein